MAALYASHPPNGEPAIFRACCHGSLAGLGGLAAAGVTADEAKSLADEAMAILRRAVARGYRPGDLLQVEPGLMPLRERDDFRLMTMDQLFPAEPIAVLVNKDFRPVPAP